jgi:putative FmdB family regulatory protein
MPIYEYSCSKCGKRIEVIQKMSDAPLKTHAGCGGRLTKEISASGFQFKGTGWYVTDYAKKGQAEAAAESTSETTEKKETTATEPAKTEKAEKSEKPAKTPKPKKA